MKHRERVEHRALVVLHSRTNLLGIRISLSCFVVIIHRGKEHKENKKKKKQAQKAFFSINFLFPKSGLHQGKKKICSQKMYAWH